MFGASPFGAGAYGAGPANADTVAPTITNLPSYRVLPRTAWSISLAADETVTWTKTGGANVADFSLTSSTLSLAALGPRITKTVQVTATDAGGNATNMTITVSSIDYRRRARPF